MSRRPKYNIIHVLLAITIIIIAVSIAGCSSTDKPAPKPGTDPASVSQEAFDLTWLNTAESEKDSMCWGIKAFGHDWAAAQLGSDEIDGDAVATMMEKQCREENR